MENLYKDYVEKDNKTFKVQLYYSLGGINCFTNKNNPRGYYVSVTPVKLEDNGHFIMETTTAWTGVKECILEVKRKSIKATSKTLSMMTDEFINNHIEYVIKMNRRAA